MWGCQTYFGEVNLYGVQGASVRGRRPPAIFAQIEKSVKRTEVVIWRNLQLAKSAQSSTSRENYPDAAFTHVSHHPHEGRGEKSGSVVSFWDRNKGKAFAHHQLFMRSCLVVVAHFFWPGKFRCIDSCALKTQRAIEDARRRGGRKRKESKGRK